jgi:hypothetical protein
VSAFEHRGIWREALETAVYRSPDEDSVSTLSVWTTCACRGRECCSDCGNSGVVELELDGAEADDVAEQLGLVEVTA